MCSGLAKEPFLTPTSLYIHIHTTTLRIFLLVCFLCFFFLVSFFFSITVGCVSFFSFIDLWFPLIAPSECMKTIKGWGLGTQEKAILHTEVHNSRSPDKTLCAATFWCSWPPNTHIYVKLPFFFEHPCIDATAAPDMGTGQRKAPVNVLLGRIKGKGN